MQKATKSQLKEVRELLRNKSARDEKGVFAAEGQKLVWDILSAGHAVRFVLVSSKVLGAPLTKKIAEKAAGVNAQVLRVPAAEYEKLSSLKSSQGVMGIVEKPKTACLEDALEGRGPVVALDGIQDPGNMGAILRCAVAFGAVAVVLVGETVDIYNPKVVRASSGAVMSATAVNSDKQGLERLKEKGLKLYASSCKKKGAVSLRDIDIQGGGVILAFGSEGRGLSSEIQTIADASFNIPIDEKVESLNVTSAVAVTLYALSERT